MILDIYFVLASTYSGSQLPKLSSSFGFFIPDNPCYVEFLVALLGQESFVFAASTAGYSILLSL